VHSYSLESWSIVEEQASDDLFAALVISDGQGSAGRSMVLRSVRTPCMQSILVKGPLSPDLHMAEESIFSSTHGLRIMDVGGNIESISRSVIYYKKFMGSTLLNPPASLSTSSSPSSILSKPLSFC
jgi:hypothetical protein